VITIKKSKAADTRSASVKVTKEMLLESSKQHISDVEQAMEWFMFLMSVKATKHDYTKLEDIDQFHKDFEQTQNTKCDFTKLPWYQKHIKEERHHLDQYVPEDVNMFDILERIADITMAGMGRNGNVYPDNLPPEVLERAYQNTITMLKNEVKVED